MHQNALFLYKFLKDLTKFIPFDSAFQKFSILTVISVYLLIAVGGIVRSTGSGMGCPDWPKCFGQYIPPTSVDELPTDYQTRFAVGSRQVAEFNVVHTWVEYINRLIGVLIGFFIFIATILALKYRTTDPPVFWVTLLSFVLVLLEGWIGAKVVATHLAPGIVTIHMLLALFIVNLLIYAVVRSHRQQLKTVELHNPNKINWLMAAGIVLALLQIVAGTQVREAVDATATLLEQQNRDSWLESIGLLFYFHRSFSIVVLVVNVLLVYEILKQSGHNQQIRTSAYGLMAVLGLEIFSGIILTYFALPKFMQPVHLLFATVLLGVQVLLYLQLNAGRLFSVSRNVTTAATPLPA